MIKVSTAVQALLAQPTISGFYLIKTEGGLRKTTAPYDIEYLGETYVSDGTVISVELPRMTSVVDKQKFKIGFADTLFSFAALAENKLVGQTVSVWMAFIDQASGVPLLNSTDILLIYKGVVDAPSHRINTSAIGGSVTFNLDCASPMSNLDRVQTHFASQDYLDKNYPGDTSYEQIFQGSGPVTTRWGKT